MTEFSGKMSFYVSVQLPTVLFGLIGCTTYFLVCTKSLFFEGFVKLQSKCQDLYQMANVYLIQIRPKVAWNKILNTVNIFDLILTSQKALPSPQLLASQN